MHKRRTRSDHSDVGKKVKRTATELQDYPDAGIRVETPTTGTPNHFKVCPQVGEKGESFRVETIHISKKSDPYQGKEHQYGGIIIYARRRGRHWYKPQDKGGYVVIKRTDTKEFKKLQEESKEPGIVHGIIYKEAFGESCNVTQESESCTADVVGEGFEIMEGNKFGTVSRAFNLRGDGDIYHDDRNEMSKLSAKCVENLVKWWMRAKSDFRNQLDHSVESLLSWNRPSFNQQLRDTDYSYSYVAILYATMRLKIFSFILTLYDKYTRI